MATSRRPTVRNVITAPSVPHQADLILSLQQTDGSFQTQQTLSQEQEAGSLGSSKEWPPLTEQEIRRLEMELEAAKPMSREEMQKHGHSPLPPSHQMSLAEFLNNQD